MIRLEIMPGRWHCRALAGAAAAGLMTLVAIVSAQQARSADVATAAPIQVSIEKFKFIPPEVTVPVGATVVWVNRDEEAHLVAAREKQFESSALDQGDTFSMTFDRPGKYPYFCLVHPQMTGVVIVGEPGR